MKKNSGDDIYKYRLAKYLLNFDPNADNAMEDELYENIVKPDFMSDKQLLEEITNNSHKIKELANISMSGFNTFKHTHPEYKDIERQEKHELLEKYNAYDIDLQHLLIEFLRAALALLVKLERMHKKNILSGNVNPYTFYYSNKNKACEPVDLGITLSDKNLVKAEKQAYGDYIYLLTDINSVVNTIYVAPELKQSITAYKINKRTIDILSELKRRNISVDNQEEIEKYLQAYHQRKIRYTNRAEIFSVGYTLNQIFSHTISKFLHYNLRMYDFMDTAADETVIHEAELMLPNSFANPEDERVVGLVNEAVEYIHDLMHEHVEKRDSLEQSIEKFASLLKRSSITKPDDMLEDEEEEDEDEEGIDLEPDEEAEEEEEHEEHKHEEHEHEEHEHGEHEHEHEHEEHEHAEHEHAEHEHEEHEHEEHEHEEHEHEEHEHEEHEHEEHEHEEHEHEEHEHEEHEHEEHEHEEHEHEEHEHEEHEHEEHEHAEHEHEEHEHEEHEHEEHEHEEHEHEDHEHEHEEHGHEHEEHEHEEHEHEEHGHEEHGHEEHGHEEHGHEEHEHKNHAHRHEEHETSKLDHEHSVDLEHRDHRSGENSADNANVDEESPKTRRSPGFRKL